MTDISPENVARMLIRLRGTPLYEGHGEGSDAPDEAADMLEALAAERDEYKRLAVAGELTARRCTIVEAERDALSARLAEVEAERDGARKANREMVMQVLAASGQAQDAWEAQKAAEAEVARLREAGTRLELALQGDSLGDVDGARDAFAAALDCSTLNAGRRLRATCAHDAVKRAAQDAREVFEGHKYAQQAVDYMEQLLLARAALKGETS